MAAIPHAFLAGHPSERLPNNTNIVFEGIVGEAVVARLDLAGIASSSGSACAAGEEGESPVMRAMGLDERLGQGSVRLTVGRENTSEDIERVIGVLPGIIESLRDLSPVPLGKTAI